MKCLTFTLLVATMCSSCVWATEASDLPPAALAEAAIRSHPAVAAAHAGRAAGQAARDQLDAGPHEFSVRVGSTQRREVGLDRRMHEQELGLERSLRLPGKAAKDSEIGNAIVGRNDSLYGEAVHETGRLLLKAWFDLLRERTAVEEWRGQMEILRQQSAIAAKRVAAGDAARIEELLTAAQQTQAEAQLAQAESRVRLASSVLNQHFPSLPIPARIGAVKPEPPAGPMEEWVERILANSHELQAARMASKVHQLQAQRADADRLPDPTLGFRWASERDGQERIVGLTLSIPLPGGARAGAARERQATADIAGAQEAMVLAKTRAEARNAYEQAGNAHAHWRRLDDVAQRLGDNAQLMEKAWRLGEGQIGDLLAARRQSVEANLAAAQARLDASAARYKLLHDAHDLWPSAEE